MVIIFSLMVVLMEAGLFHGNNYRPRGNGGYKPRFNGSRNGNTWQPWSGNSSNRFEQIPEFQIYSRKGHVAVTCLYRNDGTTNQYPPECQICGKYGHIALNCRHRGNYAYQGSQPPASLSAHYAYQGFNVPQPQCFSPHVPYSPSLTMSASPQVPVMFLRFHMVLHTSFLLLLVFKL